MVLFKPFCGVVYDHDKITDVSKVITQPYDKITPTLQDAYYANSDYSMVRLIKNKAEIGGNPYQTSKHYLESWLKEGILKKVPKECYFCLQQTYTVSQKTYTRTAIIGLGELSDYRDGKILPHEQTLRGPKADRLQQLRTTQFNLGQVFMLYRDPENTINQLVQSDLPKIPYLSYTDEENVTHALYILNDPLVNQQIQKLFKSKTFYIADGHHRYETALAFSKEQRRNQAQKALPTDYRMMTLVNAYDLGLVILPTHRLINHLLSYDLEDILKRLEQYFIVEPINMQSSEGDIQQLINKLPNHSLLFYEKTDSDICYQLTLRDYPEENKKDPKALLDLDVYMLHRIIFHNILSISQEDLANKTYVSYRRSAIEASLAVKRNEFSMGFFMKSTNVEQVLRVADEHLTMPQKSTDFYPKVLSGFVLADLRSKEE